MVSPYLVCTIDVGRGMVAVVGSSAHLVMVAVLLTACCTWCDSLSQVEGQAGTGQAAAAAAGPGAQTHLDPKSSQQQDNVKSQSDHDDPKLANSDTSAEGGNKASKGDQDRLSNNTAEQNDTLQATSVPTTTITTPIPPTPPKPILPLQTGAEAQQEEQSSGMTIFFSLLILAICIILVRLLIKYKLHFLPESVAVVSLGILMGAVIKIIESQHWANWKEEEMFRPNMFFLLLLPPIIFESGYSLHKGNFFQNIGSITLFAVFGTAISAFIVGGGVYFLGKAEVIYKLTMTDSTAEGLARENAPDVSGWQTFLQALGYFLKMFFGSAALGTLTGLISALLLKHIDLRKTPSLEFGMMIIFAYLPYGLAEGIKLSGIMAILFSGIVMSHYAHHNLSPVTQILMQQTLRTVAFMCETCVFAYIGLAIFSFPHKLEISFVIWCIVLVLFGRAVNIFPLSYLLNFFRDHKITPKMMFVMWFSGLRGAIPYALSLHLEMEPIEKRQLIGTTTIVIVLFTILVLGGGTMPLIRLMDIEDPKARRRNKKDITLSKTEKMGNTVESEHLSELTEEEYEAQYIKRHDLKGFMWLDARYLNPFFTRRLTPEDLHHGRIQMKTLTNKWYEEVRQGPSGSEDDEQELL
ncbi:sodium/hydrogen exchanger 8 isoform X2 [Carcharodon carcharias]|uniref:sodium/hydrogen exchanger 8 isoform X2 n=1 Tax=Carcharodon carcharias TaxID=13397 RepID=UPI001B7E8782|nr:sodium/hydrogen exchanger 8 isoform X2 [Carcharodon carcharias]